MTEEFDQVIDRRETNSIKWKLYGDEILPLWVADMDFKAPAPIQAALSKAVEHGIHGYDFPTRELRETVAGRMKRLYQWEVASEAVVAIPGVVAGFTAVAQAVCQPGQGVLVQPPVYPPFLSLAGNCGLQRQEAALTRVEHGRAMHYAIDWDLLEAAFHSGGVQTRLMMLCSPHNPTGQVYQADELLRIAALCREKDVILCADEIHAELLLGGATHVPVAALDESIADRTITLIAPSKTFNIPGLFCAFAIIQNEALRQAFQKTLDKLAMHVNSMGLVAAQAAYGGQCDPWLADLCEYLTSNRDLLVRYVASELPGIRTTCPQATYLAWLDCRELVAQGKIEASAHKFFLHHAKVALNEGQDFGPGGAGFVRLNFGCPERTLVTALEKMKKAL